MGLLCRDTAGCNGSLAALVTLPAASGQILQCQQQDGGRRRVAGATEAWIDEALACGCCCSGHVLFRQVTARRYLFGALRQRAAQVLFAAHPPGAFAGLGCKGNVMYAVAVAGVAGGAAAVAGNLRKSDRHRSWK
ncbi:unnamed protein product [Phaeothamnion confervicola]